MEKRNERLYEPIKAVSTGKKLKAPVDLDDGIKELLREKNESTDPDKKEN